LAYLADPGSRRNHRLSAHISKDSSVPSPRRLSTRAVAALGALYAVLVTLLLINPAAATTGQPTYTQALTSQLASEYRDPALATGVVASLVRVC
jgi:hypothetical protein